ncbi:MAG: TolC family protein [Desulfohalobiaceae bacterium]|nr:TolC family protein [Desulfohalobiaceae bacterium]
MGICGCLIILILGTGTLAPAAENATSLNLEEAYQRALSRNQDIAASRENVVQARKDVTEATSGLYPQLSAQGEYTRQKELQEETTPGTPEEYGTASLQLDQHLYQGGKRWYGRRAARENLEGARDEHFRNVQRILFRVASSYYEVLLGRRSIQIAESALERAETQLERARGRREVGVATLSDVLRAEVQVAQSEEQLERARNQFDVAREQLALEMGMDRIPRRLEHPGKRRVPDNATMQGLYSRALEHRKDLEELDNRIQAARAGKSGEKADYFPRLSAHGSYTRTDEPDIFQDNREDWRASLRLSYPLFTGGREQAQVEKARSELIQARVQRSRLEREIREQVRSVYLDLQTQRSVIRQLEKQVESAERNYKQVTARFEEGAASSVDQVDAFTALNEAENRLARARYSYQLDMVRLDLVTGILKQQLVAGKETP